LTFKYISYQVQSGFVLRFITVQLVDTAKPGYT